MAPNKRPGFYDVYGSIAVRYQNSSTLILNSKDEKIVNMLKLKRNLMEIGQYMRQKELLDLVEK